jgi:hypothetical protein
MGVGYGIFDHNTKTWLDLDRGPFDRRFSATAGVHEMAADAITGYWFEDVDAAYYSIWVCCHIYSFVRTGKWMDGVVEGTPHDVEVLSDWHDRFRDLSGRYECVGDRFLNMNYNCEKDVREWLPEDEVTGILRDAYVFRDVMEEALE